MSAYVDEVSSEFVVFGGKDIRRQMPLSTTYGRARLGVSCFLSHFVFGMVAVDPWVVQAHGKAAERRKNTGTYHVVDTWPRQVHGGFVVAGTPDIAGGEKADVG